MVCSVEKYRKTKKCLEIIVSLKMYLQRVRSVSEMKQTNVSGGWLIRSKTTAVRQKIAKDKWREIERKPADFLLQIFLQSLRENLRGRAFRDFCNSM